MSEIPADVMKTATDIAYSSEIGVVVGTLPGAIYIARAILAERNRCISIAQSIETHNEAEAHLIETIVRRIRGEE